MEPLLYFISTIYPVNTAKYFDPAPALPDSQSEPVITGLAVGKFSNLILEKAPDICNEAVLFVAVLSGVICKPASGVEVPIPTFPLPDTIK